MTATITPITDGQERQIIRFGEDAFRKIFMEVLAEAGLSKEQAQRIIEAGGVPMDDLKDFLLAELIELGRGRCADEEVSSSFTYPGSYLVKPLSVQIATLGEILGLDGQHALAYAEKLPEKPPLAKGWFAIPRWQVLADSYGRALKRIFELIAQRRSFKNWLEDKILDERHLRQHEHTVQCFERIGKAQSGPILIVPAQFGLHHRGRPVRRGRELNTPTEFGLGGFHYASMLLTHSEQEQMRKQLHIDCPGDECSPDTNGQFDRAPHFYWSVGKLFFNYWISGTSKQFGSASGFLTSDLC